MSPRIPGNLNDAPVLIFSSVTYQHLFTARLRVLANTTPVSVIDNKGGSTRNLVFLLVFHSFFTVLTFFNN